MSLCTRFYRAGLVVRTRRLILRQPREGDATALSQMFLDDNRAYLKRLKWPSDDRAVAKYFTPQGIRRTGLDLYNDMRRLYDSYNLVILRHGSDEIIGDICLYHSLTGTPKTSCYLMPDNRGRGYATEAIDALQRVAFTVEKRAFHLAETLAENIAGRNALMRAGFRPIGLATALMTEGPYRGRSVLRLRRDRPRPQGV